jgi:hypothetical protein
MLEVLEIALIASQFLLFAAKLTMKETLETKDRSPEIGAKREYPGSP